MNDDIFSGKWKQFKGSARAQWGKLTDDDVSEVDGKFEHLVGKLQERYGHAKEDATEAVNEWIEKLKS